LMAFTMTFFSASWNLFFFIVIPHIKPLPGKVPEIGKQVKIHVGHVPVLGKGAEVLELLVCKGPYP